MRGEQDVSPIGVALGWVSTITSVGLAMCLPAVAGGWLDARFGTRFLAPTGLVLGFVAGLSWLVRLAAGPKR